MKKGFTLIELLAVIIILAVIALVATPIVMDVIDDSKESGNKSSVAMYADAIELQVTTDWFKNGNYPNVTKSWADTNVEYSGNRVTCEEVYYDTTNGVLLHKCTVGGGEVSFLDNMTVHAEDKVYCYYKKEIYEDCEDATYMVNYTRIKNGSTVAYITTSLNNKVLENFPFLKLNETNSGCENIVDNDNNGVNDNYTYMDGCYLGDKPTNNYLWYSGFFWRIMGINNDGSVKLITQENVTNLAWGLHPFSYDTSYVRNWLNELNDSDTLDGIFYNSLKDTSIINVGNFCFTKTPTTQSGASTNLQATYNTTCTGTVISDKVGLISIDELNLAGASASYLRNNQYFYFMTQASDEGIWGANETGQYRYAGDPQNAVYGVRPIINVKAITNVTFGDGSMKQPYILNEDKNYVAVGTLSSNNVTSGEYVTFANKTYRVVSKNENGVKMILDSYYPTGMVYGDIGATASSMPKCNICTNNDILNWIIADDENWESKLLNTTWYHGNKMYYPDYMDYRSTSFSKTNSYNGYFGLINIGEILASQSETIINPTMEVNFSDTSNIKNYFTGTFNTQKDVWFFSKLGNMTSALWSTYYVRPVINVKIDSAITGGNGTPNNPYKI